MLFLEGQPSFLHRLASVLLVFLLLAIFCILCFLFNLFIIESVMLFSKGKLFGLSLDVPKAICNCSTWEIRVTDNIALLVEVF